MMSVCSGRYKADTRVVCLLRAGESSCPFQESRGAAQSQAVGEECGARGGLSTGSPQPSSSSFTPTGFALICVCIGTARKVCVGADSTADGCQGGERGLGELDSLVGTGTFSSLRSRHRFIVLYILRNTYASSELITHCKAGMSEGSRRRAEGPHVQRRHRSPPV